MQSQSFRTLADIWKKGWSLSQKLNPWRWAEENLEFSNRVSSFPGRFSTAATPYVREPMEKAADRTVRRITLEWSAQSAKTTTAIVIGYFMIANDPGNMLIVRPSLSAAKSLAENRMMITIDENPALAKLKTIDKDDFQKTMFKLRHMVVFIRGANPNQLSAESIKVLILDETDKYPAYSESKAEADLISLAIERTKSYRNSLVIDTSTPTLPGGSINQAFLEGTQKLFFVPCPHCGTEFDFRMEHFRFDKENPRETAHFECPHCQGKIDEKHKPAMISAGRWIAQNPNAEGEHESYRLPEFYSAITRWGDLAKKFLRATQRAKIGDFGPLHNFINSSLAEPWNPQENSRREQKQLLALADERKAGTVPDEAIGLTIGIDTQDLYFEFVVRAWGKENLQSWKVLHGRADSFAGLKAVLESEFLSVSGEKAFTITAGLLDSGGHKTSEVYDFCRSNRHLKLRPSKGERLMRRPWEISKIDKLPNGNPLPGGVKLVRVNTTYYKDLLAGKLSLNIADPGAFLLHADPDQDYLEHMTAEYRDSKGVWQCPGGKRNESWDCEVLNLCAADMIGLKFMAARMAAQETKAASTLNQGQDIQTIITRRARRPVGPNPYTEGI